MKTPMPHQREALKDIVPALKTMRRLTTIMPCGTGKTMTQLWTVEAAKPKTVLVLLPSLALLRQTLHEWMAETKWNEIDVLCVCSDMTVGKKSEDEIIVSVEELGYPVTSDTREIREFLRRRTRNVKFVFSTYHSSPLVAGGMEENFFFDIAIFDEAHVTAGEEGGFFSFALEDSNLPIKVRTFWTATPRHYNLSKMKDVGGDLPLMYSMDDEEIYGKVVHKLTFRKAVERAIICDYEVLVSVVTSKMLGVHEINLGEVTIQGKRVSAKVIAHHTALRQAIEKFDVKKIFSFHPRVADAEEFTNSGPQSAIHHLPGDFRVFHVNGEMTTAFREQKLTEFRHAKRALMSNARCLTQGIDVPNVDLVAFFSKKRSLIDIVQATGRAMRRAPGKTKGYILVPLYVEQGQGETLEEAVERSDFREVWAVLNAMREQDEALAETMSRIRITGGGGGNGRDEDSDGVITVLGPKIGIEKLRSSITTICVNGLIPNILYPTWEEAAKATQKLGIKTCPEYSERYKEDQRLPSNPYFKYQEVWEEKGGWYGFLGREVEAVDFYATWEEAAAASAKLGIKSTEEYGQRYKEDPKLPSSPYVVYKDVWEEKGRWMGYLGTLGTLKYYRTWEEASAAARKLNIKSSSEYAKRYKEDPLLHSLPSIPYADVWKTKGGWPGFLRGEIVERKTREDFYATWEEAAAAARKLGVTSNTEYRERYKEDPKLPGAPHAQYSQTWKEKGGWPGFLRGETERIDFYATWDDAATAARKLGLKTIEEYNERYKEDPKLPSRPHEVYRDVWKLNGAYPGFLRGGEEQKKKEELYATWEEASAAAQKLGAESSPQYKRLYKQDPKLPSSPNATYGKVWKQNGGWPGFLGKKK